MLSCGRKRRHIRPLLISGYWESCSTGSGVDLPDTKKTRAWEWDGARVFARGWKKCNLCLGDCCLQRAKNLSPLHVLPPAALSLSSLLVGAVTLKLFPFESDIEPLPRTVNVRRSEDHMVLPVVVAPHQPSLHQTPQSPDLHPYYPASMFGKL